VYIRWHGHSCFEIGDEAVLVTDPHDGRSIGIRPPQLQPPDLLTISHQHFDHNAVRGLEGPGTTIFCDPQPTSGEVLDVRVRGVRTYHDDVDGAKRGENIVFVMEFGSMTLCHLGDLGHVPGDDVIESIGPVDILFIPVGGTFTIDAPDARRVVAAIRPRVCVPMHYKVGGLSLKLAGVDDFLEGADPVEYVGNEVEFTREDLPEPTAVWVFSL